MSSKVTVVLDREVRERLRKVQEEIAQERLADLSLPPSLRGVIPSVSDAVDMLISRRAAP